MSDYKPISCDFYDELEAAALRRLSNEIVYLNEQGVETLVSGVVITLKTLNKEEFLTLDSGLTIRLDRLISLNGIKLANYC